MSGITSGVAALGTALASGVDGFKGFGKKVIRTRTKNFFYAKAFGAGIAKLGVMLRCSPAKAKEINGILTKRYPEMQKASREWTNFARRNGYIENAFGRKLSVDPDFAYRATNYKIQGSAADMMKMGMLRCDKYIKGTELDVHEVLTVHDELVFEILKEHAYIWLFQGIKDLMEDFGQWFDIPMEVGISKVLHSWDKEIELKIA